MQTLGSDFLIEIDTTCHALVSALVVRDACGISVAEGTPDRLVVAPASPEQPPAIDGDDWIRWWHGLLADVASDRMRHPYSGASSRLVEAVETTGCFHDAVRELEMLVGNPNDVEALREASDRLVQERDHGLHGILHASVLPTVDAKPLFITSGVLLMSRRFTATLDVETTLSLLRSYARRIGQ